MTSRPDIDEFYERKSLKPLKNKIYVEDRVQHIKSKHKAIRVQALVDAFVADQFNHILKLAGSDKREALRNLLSNIVDNADIIEHINADRETVTAE